MDEVGPPIGRQRAVATDTLDRAKLSVRQMHVSLAETVADALGMARLWRTFRLTISTNRFHIEIDDCGMELVGGLQALGWTGGARIQAVVAENAED